MGKSTLGRALMALLLTFVLSLAAPLSGTVGAATKGKTHRHLVQQGAVIEFGQTGGNIRPFTISISADGTVAYSGPVKIVNTKVRVSKDTLAAILKLAEAETFFSLPSNSGPTEGFNPDAAVPFITFHTASGSKTVQSRGLTNVNFRQLWAILLAVTTAQWGS